MAAYHDELMKFIEPSWSTTYTIENGSRNSNSINELRLGDDLKDPPVVELGRITYKNSGVNIYIPRDIVRALHLDKEKDTAFVM